MRRLIPILAAALLGAGLTAGAIAVPAWGGAGDDSGDRIRSWERCMRDAGFDAEKFHAAEAKCGAPFDLPLVPELPRRPDELPLLPKLDLLPGLDDLLPRLDVPAFPGLPREIVPPERCVTVSA